MLNLYNVCCIIGKEKKKGEKKNALPLNIPLLASSQKVKNNIYKK